MFSIKQDAKVQNNECVVWPTELTKNMDFDKGFAPNKPLMSILDLGKLLLQYSKDGDATKVNELIIKGAPFNADWLGMTPLHYAAKKNNYGICDMLLRGGINKDAKTKVDRTALHFAVYEGNKEIVELLLSRNAEINIKDMLRMTALHWAIEKRHKSIARLLINHGADVSALSKFNKTPMAVAVQTGQVDLLDELEAARHNQRSKILMETHENQKETNEAVNSITIINTPMEDDEMSWKNENSNDQILSTDKPTNSSIKNSKTHIDNNQEEADYVEPIVNLIDDTKQIDESALEMLKTHGITMLPTDNPQNLLTSALEGGRKLVLSEAGKLVLKNTNHIINSHSVGENILRRLSHNHINNLNRSNNRKVSYLVKAKPESQFKSNKNVKIITMDMFKQMYSGEVSHRLKRVVKPNFNGTPSPTKVTKLIKLNNVNKKPPIVHKISIEKFRNQSISDNGKGSESDELPPNIIEVCSESDQEDDTIEESITPSQIKIPTLQSSSFPLTTKPFLAVTPQVHDEIPTMELREVCRRLHDLQKQMEDLRRQLEQSQKQHDECHNRLESLERNQEPYS